MMRSSTACCLALFLGFTLAASYGAESTWLAPQPDSFQPGPLLQSMLDGPLSEVDEIVFAMRIACNDHWYVNFGYYCNEPEKMGFGEGGRLCRLNLRSGKLNVLLDDPLGGVRDPQLHYDGDKILFSYRKGGTPTYHLYEIQTDGSGLRQLTFGPDDDIEPTYLPDGGIVFGSSRCRRMVNCWITRVTTLYRCDADGSNIRMLSSNNDHDNTPWTLPDGRVLYMRWEYVDRSQVHFHHLWTTNPDGTGQMVSFGNQQGGVAMLDAKPIRSSDKIVASFSPGHGRPEHMGSVAVVDLRGGPDVSSMVRQVSQGNQLFRDPYGMDENCFLVADAKGIHVMDRDGNTEAIYRVSESDGSMQCHEPRPILARPREPVIAPQVDLDEPTAHVVLADIYHGRSMGELAVGQIKKLLVLEQLPKPVNFSGGQDPISIGGTFTLARILGTVPVEPDGSASIELPALRSLFFVALDENDLSVRRMQSFMTLQPGETVGCVGCHEHRSETSPPDRRLAALAKPAQKIQPIDDVPDVIDFVRDVQPILDQHCATCHNAKAFEGQIDLSGDHTPVFSVSYWTLTKLGLVADGRNNPYSLQAPRTIGSSASRLMQLIDGSHHDAKLTDPQRKLIRLWIDTSAPYPGTYAALGSGAVAVELPYEMLSRRCGECHHVAPIQRPHQHYVDFHTHFGPKDNKLPPYLANAPWQHPMVPQSRCNLTNPELSILLRAPLAKSAGGLQLCGRPVFTNTDDVDYQELLRTIDQAADQLRIRKRFDMPGFQPNEHYLREMRRFEIEPQLIPGSDQVDVYATDQAYWRSFWYRQPLRH
ncbi:HzsA-related protein [Novipirellula artificiosorum]|uniref:Translocation protein TolB n=1 Tax=Novipirellula artificiosorum TaxID=2528016 RepID=A0A5C6DFJ1_9BACT|nr:hypothetical protein [Novipirellula artificiosorum]TWU33729.1 translocation protein TolB [Novipirellula artificiosorum]